AHNSERRRPARFDDARVEPRDLRRAAHIEVEIAAPELLDAVDRLSGLEARLDHIEVVTLVAAGALGDLVDHGGQVGMQHPEPHGVGVRGAQDGRACDHRGCGDEQAPTIDHGVLLQWPLAQLLSRRMISVSSRRSALACAELRSRGRGMSTVTYSPTRPGEDVMMAMRAAR